MNRRIWAFLVAIMLVIGICPPHILASEAAADDKLGYSLGQSAGYSIEELPDEAFLPPDENAPQFSPFALSGTVDIRHNRTVEDVVDTLREYPHSGFTSNKVTRYAAGDEPQFTAPHYAGSLNQDDMDDTLNALKMVRYLAGLPYETLRFTDPYNNTAQHKSVMMAAFDLFAHGPKKPDGLAQDFYDTAQSYSYECIYAGISNTAYSILGFVADPGSNNIQYAGHRRNLFVPGIEEFGLGYAQYDGSSYRGHRITIHSERAYAAAGDYYAWPSDGDFPIQYFSFSNNVDSSPVYPWSLYLGADYKAPSRSDITLTVKRLRDSKTWVFDDSTPCLTSAIGSSVPDYRMHLDVSGKNITFRPDVTSLGALRDGDVFQISLSGIKDANDKATTLNYSINFFDLGKEMNRSTVTFRTTHNGAPVANAAVTADGVTVYSDADGYAKIRVENNRSYRYTVAAAGYAPEEGTVEVEEQSISHQVPLYLPVSFVVSDASTAYSGAPHAVPVAATPNVAYTVTYNGVATPPTTAGSYTVVATATEPGYKGSATASLVISKLPLTVTADDCTIAYGDNSVAYPLTYSGFIPGESSASLQTRPQAAPETDGALQVGSYPLHVSGGASDNYDFQYHSGTLTIVPRPLTPRNITVFNKQYVPGDTRAVINAYIATLDGLLPGDDVKLDISAASAHFQSDTIGDSKRVVISGLALSGADKGNYTLSSSS
ncbi:MBG domain-containing protein, partial [Ruminococcaceae bacterium OttesenSCG-928-L11]|nr:MBG domain-containing protein [Ruminococcaceae bacterium OttesenSCG-928-L11]